MIAIEMPQLPVPEIAAGDLDGLCRFVWSRISYELCAGSLDDRPAVYHPLAERLHRARAGVTMLATIAPTPAARAALLEEFEQDLRRMATLPAVRLRAMVANGSASASGLSPHAAMEVRTRAHAAQAAAYQANTRPRVSPGELVQAFATRGVTIKVLGADLHVTPAAMLSEADRAVLREHKPAILEALAGPAAVL